MNRRQEWPENVAVTVMQDSTIGGQLGVLRHYRFRLDLCTWRLWRRQTQNGVSLRVGHDDPAEAPLGEAP